MAGPAYKVVSNATPFVKGGVPVLLLLPRHGFQVMDSVVAEALIETLQLNVTGG